jgi:hypothetical protein
MARAVTPFTRTLPTREAWLLALVNELRPLFARRKAAIPRRVRVSVGWPSRKATSRTGRRIGECWAAEASTDGTPHVFVSPTLASGLEVAGVLVHELIHAHCGAGEGHGRTFGRIARRLGLEGKLTATVPGPELRADLQALIAGLGPYPHAALNPGHGAERRQSTRMVKLMCASCGYSVRTTRKWLAVGQPLCPDGEPLRPEEARP